MKLMKIKEFAEVVSGSTPKTNIDEYWNGEYIWITPAEIDNSSKYIYDSERKITEAGVKSCSLKLLKKNTVILTSRAPIGKVALAGNDLYCNQGFKNLVCDESIIYPKYIYYWLISKKEYLNSLGRGATFKEISKKIVEEIQVPVLSIDDQKRMAQILDKSQDLIDKRKEQIELLDELVKSRFIEVFGSVIMNNKGWKTELLGEICELKAGKNIKAKDIYEDNSEDLYPCYGGNGLRGYVKTYSHEGNINLIGRQGALCGNVKYAKGKFYATEHAVVTQPKVSINSYWLHFVLRELDLNRLSTGAAQPGLTVGKLNEVEIPKVPIKIQNEFADFAKQVDKLKFEMENSLKELEDNFNSLMQKAFKGELF